MSDQEEKEFDSVDPETESEDAFAAENIPAPSGEPERAEQTEKQEPEADGPGEGRVVPEEGRSDHSVSSLESSDEGPPAEEGRSTSQTPPIPRQKRKQSPADSLELLDRIKAVKEALQTSVVDSSATVKVILIPVGQEIIISYKVDSIFKNLKDYFSQFLSVPAYLLQIKYAGKIVKNNESLIQYGVKPQDIIQVEIFSANQELYPITNVAVLKKLSHIITVTIETGIDQSQEVVVEIIKSDFHKPFLGGFRHKITGVEYHNAGTQTVPKKISGRPDVFCRDTQTVSLRKKFQQTANTTSTQMTKIGVYVSNITDKLVTPGKYFSSEDQGDRRLQAVITIQTYYRRWHARVLVENLKIQKKLRLEWEAEEELRKQREKEEWMQLDYYRRHNPKTNDDFELLYNALELWKRKELDCINQSFTGAERKAALCELLEKETQLIASIERHRYDACMTSQEEAVQAFLDKCSAPKSWKTATGNIIEMDTQFTLRARELQNIYKCILLKNLSQDERLDVLLTLKHTVKEHACKLTQEILELIDREVDLMMRGVRPHNLEGLRKRIATLFLHYIKTPLFNPEVARHLKVPQDPLKFYRKIYFCHSCQLYLPSTEFPVSSTTHRLHRCRHCINLENETRQRESFLKYKCLLQRLYRAEAEYEDDSRIAFLMQLQDIQYLTENIWASQSVLSDHDDLSDLVMVRWDKSLEWSPWNCILLTKDEAAAHLKLRSVVEGYRPLFIHTIKHKHILAKNYFAQIPALASFILDDPEIEEIRKMHHSDTAPKVIKVQKPCT